MRRFGSSLQLGPQLGPHWYDSLVTRGTRLLPLRSCMLAAIA